MSWGFEDMLPAPDANSSSSSENKGELFHDCQYYRGRQDAFSGANCLKINVKL